ncbi:hypothetical protein I0C86_19930 [Plantactinospora sp. S1510]|uniref:Uncharacterized protein n=1 Tax=Plantactinospora alkalitolerans TaxID=2789879 RepID=A0ABS0GZ46_9ACTN|nr:hypothetical protein [Plantactinospora alkalitolerans]MBF9131213.1 hypothetical protein [Plantactinospora alkalitolerans]
MHSIGFGSDRRTRMAAMVVALAGAMAMGLAGCGADAAPTGAPATTGVPTVVPSADSGTSSPNTAEPTAGESSAPPGEDGSGSATVPGRTAPGRPTGTPKPPASYDPAEDITDLVAQTNGLRLNRPVDGVRHGELVVTIRNSGPEPVWGLTFTVEVPESMAADGGDWSGCSRLRSTRAGNPAGAKCEKGYLAPGQSRGYRLGIQSPATKDGADSPVSRWLVDVWSAGQRGQHYRDLGPDDNSRIFLVDRA